MIDPKNELTWNFSLCPANEEELCYFFEYMWEISWLREAFAEWKKHHRGIERHAAQGDVPNWQAWTEQLTLKRPVSLTGVGGSYFSLLVVFADYFPEKHWLEIPAEVRRERRPRVFGWRPVMEISDLQFNLLQIGLAHANSQSDNLTYQEALSIGRSEGQSHLPNRTHSFWINWKVAPEQIKRCLAEWVDEYSAQLDRIYPDRKIARLTGKNTPSDWLKFLAAMRLMEAYGQDWRRCAEERAWREREKSGTKRKMASRRGNRAGPIYSSRSTEWQEAAKLATSEIRKFAHIFALRSAQAQGG